MRIGFGDGITMFGALLALLPSVGGSTRTAEPLPARPTPEVSFGDETETGDGLKWPDDWDAVPSWRLEAEARANDAGLLIPPYRTRREYEAMVRHIEARLLVQSEVAAVTPPAPEPVTVVVIAADPLPALGASEAAAEFLAHLRAKGFGHYTNESLTEEYLRLCRANNRTPAPENFVRQKLRRMVGITSRMVDDRDELGKRVRWTQWTVVPFSSEKVAA